MRPSRYGGVITLAATYFDHVIEQYHHANREFVRGNRGPLQQLFSHRDDVTLLNPAGGAALGWEQVFQSQERALGSFSVGEATGFETLVTYVTPELAFIVEIERRNMRFSGSQEMAPRALRATTIFRPEDGTWRIVHRHADLFTVPRPPDSITQTQS